MHQPLAATESKVSTGCREGLVHCAFGSMHPTVSRTLLAGEGPSKLPQFGPILEMKFERRRVFSPSDHCPLKRNGSPPAICSDVIVGQTNFSMCSTINSVPLKCV